MVTAKQIEQGLSYYLDNELMPKLPSKGVYRVGIGTFVAIVLRRTGTAIESMKHNAVANALGIVDPDGNVDIDIIADELKKQMPSEGINFRSRLFGDFNLTINSDDVEEIRRCIMENQICY